MKITGIALIVIGFALLVFAGVSHFALTPDPDAIEKTTNPSAPIFSPAITLIVAVLAVTAGFLVLRFGGQGYSEKAVKPASPPQR